MSVTKTKMVQINYIGDWEGYEIILKCKKHDMIIKPDSACEGCLKESKEDKN